MSILLRANYLLYAEVLQPEPSEQYKRLLKALRKKYFRLSHLAFNASMQRCYE